LARLRSEIPSVIRLRRCSMTFSFRDLGFEATVFGDQARALNIPDVH
jgi:hypothetical protein